MSMQFANVWERVADTVGDEIALINGDKKSSWSSFDSKAAKIATILEEHGLKSDSKVGIYLHNSNEYLEAQYGVFKIEGVPINVNYRYKENELIYLLDNADAEAVFFQGCYADRIKAIKDQLPKIKAYIQVDDGTEPLMQGAIDFENSISSAKEQKRFNRTEENIYMLYTGGTTGMSKGVMYKHGSFIPSMLKTAFAMGFEVPEDISDLEKIVSQAKENNALTVSMPACPLMHGTGMWLGAFLPMFSGGSVVTISDLGLNPKNVWQEVERHKVNSLVISNVDASAAATITIGIYPQDDIAGTAVVYANAVSVAPNSFLVAIDKDVGMYLEEDTSLGVTASAANDLTYTITYEELS